MTQTMSTKVTRSLRIKETLEPGLSLPRKRMKAISCNFCLSSDAEREIEVEGWAGSTDAMIQ